MDESLIIVRQYCVEGRVQGVGFRWFVHREAGWPACAARWSKGHGEAAWIVSEKRTCRLTGQTALKHSELKEPGKTDAHYTARRRRRGQI